jgi:hypothetical protein
MESRGEQLLQELTAVRAEIETRRNEVDAATLRANARNQVIAQEVQKIEILSGTFAGAPTQSLGWLPPDIQQKLVVLNQEPASIAANLKSVQAKLVDAENAHARICFLINQPYSGALACLQRKRSAAEAEVEARFAAASACIATLSFEPVSAVATATTSTATSDNNTSAPTEFVDALAAAQRALVGVHHEIALLEHHSLANSLGVGFVPGCVVAAEHEELRAFNKALAATPHLSHTLKRPAWNAINSTCDAALRELTERTKELQAHTCQCQPFTNRLILPFCDIQRRHADASLVVQRAHARLNEQQRAHQDALAELSRKHATQLARCAAQIASAEAARASQKLLHDHEAQRAAMCEQSRREQDAAAHRFSASAIVDEAGAAIARAQRLSALAQTHTTEAVAANAPALARARAKLEALERGQSLVDAAAEQVAASVRAVEEARAHHERIAHEITVLVQERDDARARVRDLDARLEELRLFSDEKCARASEVAAKAADEARASHAALSETLQQARDQLAARNALFCGATNAVAQADALRALDDAELDAMPTSITLLLHAVMQETSARGRVRRARAEAEAEATAAAAARAQAEAEAEAERLRAQERDKLIQLQLQARAAEAAAETHKSMADAVLCVVCMDAPKTVLLMPCRHNCVCVTCAAHLGLSLSGVSQTSGRQKQKKTTRTTQTKSPSQHAVCSCPICREPVSSAMEMYA